VPEFSIRLGVHVSIAGGIEKAISRARALGCSAMQIFSRNPRGWKTSPLSLRAIAAFLEAIVQREFDPIVVHTPYLLNLASADERLHRKSILALALDLKRAEQLGARYVVTHLGSAKERGRAFGLHRVVKALQAVVVQDSPVSILLENSAGAGNSIGTCFAEFQEIIERVGKHGRLGVCFDSCHGYAAGYDFRSAEATEALVREMDQTIGVQRLGLLHLNDCKGSLGSHLDRHEHIGKGKIGLAGFRSLLSHPSFRRVPMILETPKKSPEDDLKNLSRIRNLIRKGPGR
jgi:deoxyribonuclease-4